MIKRPDYLNGQGSIGQLLPDRKILNGGVLSRFCHALVALAVSSLP